MADLVRRQIIWCWMSWEVIWCWKRSTKHRQNSTCLMRRYFPCFPHSETVLLQSVSQIIVCIGGNNKF